MEYFKDRTFKLLKKVNGNPTETTCTYEVIMSIISDTVDDDRNNCLGFNISLWLKLENQYRHPPTNKFENLV